MYFCLDYLFDILYTSVPLPFHFDPGNCCMMLDIFCALMSLEAITEEAELARILRWASATLWRS